MSVARPAQLHLNAGAAIGLTTVLVEADDLLQELRILQGSGAWLSLAAAPVIIATGRYWACFEKTDTEVVWHIANGFGVQSQLGTDS